MAGFIYLRNHESYESYDVLKLGKTKNILEREKTYITGEIKRGVFVLIIKIDNIDQIELMLQDAFKNLHYQSNGGVEFFNKQIKNEIISFLEINNLKFQIMDYDGLSLTPRKYEKPIQEITPFDYQSNILNIIQKFYEINDIGKLIYACGLGKTFMALFIVKKMNFKTILIGVPSIYLQQQIKDEINKIFKTCKIFTKFSEPIDTDIPHFYVTTYMSAHKYSKYKFDFKIGDEMHHLASSFDDFPKIESTKTLYMTATEKPGDFGELIDKKSVKWAIENKKITDYQCTVIKNTNQEIVEIMNHHNIINNNLELFLAAYSAVKSLNETTTHILIYTNSIESSKIICEIVSLFRPDIYNNCLNSESKYLNYEIKKFTDSKFGIISCVYIFGEGFNLPKLNAVLFAENMESEVRIIQSILRPNRLDPLQPGKIANVIIPLIDNFDKCRRILTLLQSEDDNIMCKIHAKSLTKHGKYESTEYEFVLNTNYANLYEIELKSKLGKYFHLPDNIYEYELEKLHNKQNNITERKVDREHYYTLTGAWKGHYDFLNIDTGQFIKEKYDWKSFCMAHSITENNYIESCKTYKNLPLWPEELYSDFSNLKNELSCRSRRKNNI